MKLATSEPCLTTRADGGLRSSGGGLPVDGTPGEPAPALLVTGGCSEISSETSTSVPELEWEGTAALSAAGKSPSQG